MEPSQPPSTEAVQLARALIALLSEAQRAELRAALAAGKPETALRAVPALAGLLDPQGALPAPLHAAFSAALPGGAESEEPAPYARLRAGGGAFYSMLHGPEAAREIASGFSEADRARDPLLILLDAVNALKAGNTAHADRLVGTLRGASTPLDQDLGALSPDLVCFLFMKAIYEDSHISDPALSQLFGTLERLAPEDALRRGLLYNVALDVFIRRGAFAEAEETALRALHHFTRATAPGLSFYIQLYLGVIGLTTGEITGAGQHLRRAEEALTRFEGQTGNDRLLLRSLKLIQRYETGEPGPLIEHLMRAEVTIPYGELWPAMAEPILAHGRRALGAEVTQAAALAWVRRWRVQQWRSQRFDRIISIQEALALMRMRRWQEADELLARLPGGDEPDLVIARLTSAVERAPKSHSLAAELRAALGRPGLSPRPRARLLMLSAQAALARGAEGEAARFLAEATEEAGPARLPAFFPEQRHWLRSFSDDPRLRAELRRRPALARALRASLPGARPRKTPLTRQETRILGLLAEGLPNKLMSQRMGLSLPTVKFHLSNLYRKLGVRNRRAAVEAALAKGWLESESRP